MSAYPSWDNLLAMTKHVHTGGELRFRQQRSYLVFWARCHANLSHTCLLRIVCLRNTRTWLCRGHFRGHGRELPVMRRTQYQRPAWKAAIHFTPPSTFTERFWLDEQSGGMAMQSPLKTCKCGFWVFFQKVIAELQDGCRQHGSHAYRRN